MRGVYWPADWEYRSAMVGTVRLRRQEHDANGGGGEATVTKGGGEEKRLWEEDLESVANQGGLGRESRCRDVEERERVQ